MKVKPKTLTQNQQPSKATFIREIQVTYKTTASKRESLITSEQVAELIRSLLPDNSREHFIALYLDGCLLYTSPSPRD